MNITSTYNETLSATIIKNMAKRHLNGYYAATKEEAVQKALSLLEGSQTISWGGSMTLEELGLLNALRTQNTYTLLDRSKVPAEEVPNLYREAFSADCYLMSSNAITVDGKLVNIDGTGNRAAALIYGPKKVIILAGMNKVVKNEEEALSRVHQIACPKNAIRLNKKTPCALTGVCGDCLTPDCICAQTVITRFSREANRIHVILVGENLGY